MNPSPLWQPSPERIAAANLTAFMRYVRERCGADIRDYPALYDWSIADPDRFWLAVWSFCGVIASIQGETVLADRDKMPGARWFPDARLNFAENLLRRRDDATAIVFWGEDRIKSSITYAELHAEVSRMAQALQAVGIKRGDRVAAYMPNLPGTVIAMLAATSLGAVWSSCSPDFGVQGVLDRFGQIEPSILFAADGYFYNGKTINLVDRLKDIAANLPSLQKIIVVPYTRGDPDIDGIPNAVNVHDFMNPYHPREIDFVQLPFDHPLYIMYSSGTTGVP
ncbi:MAG: AMP-binding protein, partial [Burkholderiales bacterium]|nr:AMP-binding protein [Burkholderiales bacterium]